MNIKHINIIIFCAILIVFGSINIITPDEQVKIESENRLTKAMPEFSFKQLFSGEYFRDFDAFFADNFVMRDTYVSTSKKINTFRGLDLGDKVEIVEYAGANVDQEKNTTPNANQNNTEENYGTGEGTVQDSKWGKIFIYNDAAMELNTYSEVAAERYAKSINAYTERFENINVYSLLVPTQIEFIDDKRYESLSVSQRETIASTQEFFNDKVISVNILDNLAAHVDEYIFFRTDHHWTQRGAFYGYQVFAELLGERKPLLKDYKVTSHGEFLGSLYKVTMNEKLTTNPDYIEILDPQITHSYYGLSSQIKYNKGEVYVREWLETDEKYAVYLGGDQPIVKIETDQRFGRNILVLKDSYANAFVPFLVGVADNIVVIDPRLFDGKVEDVIDKHSITDILFVNYALITRWDGYSELYMKLLK